MSTLRLPRAVFSQIRAHGEATYPLECCGVLLGSAGPEGWTVSMAVPARNVHVDAAQNRYQIDPLELVKIEREARRISLDIAGFYHSHPDRAAQPSVTDFAEAHWLGCSYLIIEVAQGHSASTQSFLLAGPTEEAKRFEPQTIHIEDAAPGATPPGTVNSP